MTLSDKSLILVEPWSKVKQYIREKILARKGDSQKSSSLESGSISPLETHAVDSNGSPQITTEEELHVPLTLAHGFKMLSSATTHTASIIKCVHYSTYNADMFLTLDSTKLAIWAGGKKVKSLSTHVGEKKGGEKESTVAGCRHMLYVKAWRCFIIGNVQMQLKVHNFKCFQVISRYSIAI